MLFLAFLLKMLYLCTWNATTIRHHLSIGWMPENTIPSARSAYTDPSLRICRAGTLHLWGERSA